MKTKKNQVVGEVLTLKSKMKEKSVPKAGVQKGKAPIQKTP